MTSPVTVSRQSIEKQHMQSLNAQFASYLEKVKLMRDQCKTAETNVLYSNLESLQNEIFELKTIYDREVDNLRNEVDSLTSERNSLHMEATKNGALMADFDEKYKKELTSRKQLENALADAHRLLSEKDSLIQELRITIAQHQNANLEVSKERDSVQTQLTTVSINYENEVKVRKDCEAALLKMTDQRNFDRELFERDCCELKARLEAAERAIAIADDKFKEMEISDAQLSQQFEAIRRQAQTEFSDFQQKTESVYQQQYREHREHLDAQAKALADVKDENIHLKAIIEELNSKCHKLDSKCGSIHEQNNQLIHTLENERRQSAKAIHDMEDKVYNLRENLNEKVRELNVANNQNSPLYMEIDAFTQMLIEEEKRLKTAIDNPPVNTLYTARGEGMPSYRSQFAASASSRNPPISNMSSLRKKSLPCVGDGVKTENTPVSPKAKYCSLPPLSSETTRVTTRYTCN